VSNAERIVSVTACEAGISKAVEAPQWHDSAEFSCANRNDDRRCGRRANSASVVATEFVDACEWTCDDKLVINQTARPGS
jgi:hypothetical protein